MKRLLSAAAIVTVLTLMFALPGKAQKKGKTRPLTSSQLMAGLVMPQFTALKESLEKGIEDDEGWKKVSTSAALLNESSFIMMADVRSPDDTWERACDILNKGSVVMLEKIAVKDSKGALAAIDGIVASCKHCHEAFKYKK